MVGLATGGIEAHFGPHPAPRAGFEHPWSIIPLLWIPAMHPRVSSTLGGKKACMVFQSPPGQTACTRGIVKFESPPHLPWAKLPPHPVPSTLEKAGK